ncbi:MAG TPA: hypothetical protein DCW68_04545 [Rhodospirillaceae bacterium]|nr:MAG: hypothetical protein A2018_03105 [Alphaproteobacteria bacterium GWF2_58_20]HAU29366.1 hypothetical protein [Rhodospirillaceae bacterium]
MAWSENKIASEIGLPFRLKPGRPVVCACEGMNKEGNIFFGMKAEVHLCGDNHRMDLIVSNWQIDLGKVDPAKIGMKPDPSINLGPVLYIQLERNRQGDFEFSRASIGKSAGICFAPSYERPVLETFYNAANAISSGCMVDVEDLWLKAMLGNLSSMVIGAKVEHKTLPWVESLPEDMVGQPEPRKPIGYKPEAPGNSHSSVKNGKPLKHPRLSITKPATYRPRVPGRE